MSWESSCHALPQKTRLRRLSRSGLWFSKKFGYMKMIAHQFLLNIKSALYGIGRLGLKYLLSFSNLYLLIELFFSIFEFDHGSY